MYRVYVDIDNLIMYRVYVDIVNLIMNMVYVDIQIPFLISEKLYDLYLSAYNTGMMDTFI